MISKILGLLCSASFRKAGIVSTARILLPGIVIILTMLCSDFSFFTNTIHEDMGGLTAKDVERFSDKTAKEFLLAPVSKFASSSQAVVTGYGTPSYNAYTSIDAGDTAAYPESERSKNPAYAENNRLNLPSRRVPAASTPATSPANAANTQSGQSAFWAPYYLPATGTGGTTGPGTGTVTPDTVAPIIIITSPIDGSIVNSTPITVFYTVDGIAKTKSVPLVEGPNIITITEADSAGNSASARITVTLKMINAPSGLTLQIVPSSPYGPYVAACDSYTAAGFSYYPKRYKYDIWLSNKSNAAFKIDKIDIKSIDSGNQIVAQMSKTYPRPYRGPALEDLLNNNTFFIISLDGLSGPIAPDNFLYFSCIASPKIDKINWETAHELPANSEMSLLFPFENYFANGSVKKITIAIEGADEDGERLVLTSDISPIAYDDPRQYRLPVGIPPAPSEYPAGLRWKVLEGSTLNSSHRRGGIWEAKDGIFYYSNLTRYALDFVIVDNDGGQYPADKYGNDKTDYYCWGQPIYAVEGGTVSWVTNDAPDNDNPNQPPQPPPGGGPPLANGLTIDHGDGTVSYYYHMQCGSIPDNIFPGAFVEKGAHIGSVGNSGTMMPHLHYHLMKDPSHYVGQGNPNWTVLPEGVPTEFKDFYLFNAGIKTYMQKGTIDVNDIVEQNVPLISISLEGPEWTINGISLGEDRYSTVDGTKDGVPKHAIVNEGDVDVKVVMNYVRWEGVDPSYDSLVDHFQTSAALESGHLITIQPPDSPNPQAVIRNSLKAGSRSPVYFRYTAPSGLTKPTTQMRAYYEIRAYPIEET